MGDQASGGGVPAPLPLAKRIIGYCDPLSAAPGEQVRFFVSCEPGIGSVRADLVRLRAGPPGWEVTGPECEPVPGKCAGTYPARHQEVHPGSYALIPGGGEVLRGGTVSLVLLVQPTYRSATPQVLVSAGDPWAGPGFALVLDEQLKAGPDLRCGRARPALTGPAALEPGVWSVVTATFGGDAPGGCRPGR